MFPVVVGLLNIGPLRRGDRDVATVDGTHAQRKALPGKAGDPSGKIRASRSLHIIPQEMPAHGCCNVLGDAAARVVCHPEY